MENEKARRYNVVNPDNEDPIEDCSICPALRLMSADLIPPENLELFRKLDLLKIRLGYNRKTAEIFMNPVIYLCEDSSLDDEDLDVEGDECYKIIKIGTAELSVYVNKNKDE